MNNAYKAYDRILVNHEERTERLYGQLDKLLEISNSIESDLLRQLKPTVALALKWRFDLFIKTMESPFEIEHDIEYWINVLQALDTLGECGWYEKDGIHKQVDPWDRTAAGFDLGWTTTTKGQNFEISKQIAKDRLEQIYEKLGGRSYFAGKTILDSGCGPGRYVDELRQLDPEHIVALDQGQRLIDVLNERFKGDNRVQVLKGTCEDLSQFDDNSFDVVFSNGVIHHTQSDLQTMFMDHARVLKPGGAMFIMLIGKAGLELKLWEFLRAFLNDIPMEKIIETFGSKISPLRLQGIVDHMYGEYQETDRAVFEGWCDGVFSKVEPVAGIAGLDVTPEIYHDDPYFEARFGCGHLRYVLTK